MNIELSERDKKLLLNLAIFVLVVCIGYFGVLPNILKGINNRKLIDKENEKSGNEQLISSQLPIVMGKNSVLQAMVESEREKLSEYMSNAELGAYIGKCIKEAGLTAYDMNIREVEGQPGVVSIAPYKLSDKSKTGESEVLSQADAMLSKKVGANGILMDNISEPTEMPEAVLASNVSVRVSGDEAAMLQLVDTLSDAPGVVITGYSLDGVEKRYMNISLSVYMRKG